MLVMRRIWRTKSASLMNVEPIVEAMPVDGQVRALVLLGGLAVGGCVAQPSVRSSTAEPGTTRAAPAIVAQGPAPPAKAPSPPPSAPPLGQRLSYRCPDEMALVRRLQ